MNTIVNYNTINYQLDCIFKTESKDDKGSSSVEISYSDVGVLYTKSDDGKTIVNKKAIESMKDETEHNMIKILKESVMSSLSKQSGGLRGMIQKLLNGELDVKVTKEDIEKAQADIAEGGYWSAEATSDRLVDFAKSVSSADSSKGTMLIDAIKEGFIQAKKAWGGELPSICQDTYDLTMKKMDEWINGNKSDETAA